MAGGASGASEAASEGVASEAVVSGVVMSGVVALEAVASEAVASEVASEAASEVVTSEVVTVSRATTAVAVRVVKWEVECTVAGSAAAARAAEGGRFDGSDGQNRMASFDQLRAADECTVCEPHAKRMHDSLRGRFSQVQSERRDECRGG